MSKPRFKMVLIIDTMAHAQTIRNSIVSELVGKDIFEQHSLGASINENGEIEGVAEWRFNNDVDRDAIRTWLQNQVQNHPQVKNWVSSARLSWHRCTHDEVSPESCKATDYLEWTK